MTTTRPPYQQQLALPIPGWGEAPRPAVQEVEMVKAVTEPESPASTERLMEAICDPDNIEDALASVVRNKGAAGIDGITVKQLPAVLKARWPEIEEQLLTGATRRSRCAGWKSPSPTAASATSAFQP